ncbi:MAG: dihydrofolate reductase [Betaproteobacteria bacterium]
MTAAIKPRLSMIVAMAKNRIIGADGKIPWHLPNELQLFKSVTMGHHIIMGRKTYESINRLLPGRSTVIVTRQKNYTIPGAKIAHTLDEAIALCAGDSEIFVIGGGELYRAAMPKADRIYLTVVDAEPAGDTLMPEFDAAQWRVHSTKCFGKDERHAHDYRFEIHDRVVA